MALCEFARGRWRRRWPSAPGSRLFRGCSEQVPRCLCRLPIRRIRFIIPLVNIPFHVSWRIRPQHTGSARPQKQDGEHFVGEILWICRAACVRRASVLRALELRAGLRRARTNRCQLYLLVRRLLDDSVGQLVRIFFFGLVLLGLAFFSSFGVFVSHGCMLPSDGRSVHRPAIQSMSAPASKARGSVHLWLVYTWRLLPLR